MLDFIVQNSMVLLASLGFLAFIVNIITEMTKDINPIKKIPTKLYVILVSIIVNFLCLIIYNKFENKAINISYFIIAFIASFVVAYISTYGWDTFNELKDRFTIKNGDDIND